MANDFFGCIENIRFKVYGSGFKVLDVVLKIKLNIFLL